MIVFAGRSSTPATKPNICVQNSTYPAHNLEIYPSLIQRWFFVFGTYAPPPFHLRPRFYVFSWPDVMCVGPGNSLSLGTINSMSI